VFQHLPFLQAQNKARDYDLVSIGKTFVFPMGLYSKKINKISDCPDAAVVAIPSDPTNEGRALLLLQASQLIRLRSGVKFSALPQDVVYNPKHIKLIELDAAQLPRSLADVTLAAINTNFAVPAGLLPKRDALFLEKNDSPYANIVVVRRRDRADPRLAQWLAALQSPQVVAKAAAVFSAAAIPAFKLTASDRSAG
jgi:D-methionine transport system substrate-binding protein